MFTWRRIFYQWHGTASSLLYAFLLLSQQSLMGGEPLKIRPKLCSNAFGEEGTCMFVWECIKTEGKHLGTCADGFLFGSCCGHNDSTNSINNHFDTSPSLIVSTLSPSSTVKDKNKVKDKPTTALATSALIVTSSTTIATTHAPTHRTTTTRPTKSPTFPPSTVISTKPVTLKPTIVQTFLTIRPANSTKPSGYVTPTNYKPVTTVRPWHVYTGGNKPIFGSTYRPSYVSVGPVKMRPPIYLIRPTIRPTNTTVHQDTYQNHHHHQSNLHYTPPPSPTNVTHTSLIVSSDGKNPSFPGLGIGEGTIVITSNLSPVRPHIPINQTMNTIVVTNSTNSATNQSKPISSGDNEESGSSSTKYECGVTQMRPKSKVVGGKNSAFGAWPWQVSVRRTSFFGFSSTHRCGGALLNSRWIATAGHCVDDLLLSQIRIRVGEYDFSTAMEPLPYIERSAKKKVVHPKYNFFTYENDLALVQLDEPLEFMPHVAPICLPPDDVELLGKNATVTGWGRLSEGGVLPTVLQEVRVPIVSNDRCKNMFLSAGRHEYIPDIFMCAGFEEGGRDSCQGDSGGPLQVQGDDGNWFLAGIISWGIGCGEPSLPGVCTRITKFKNWILTYIGT